MVKILRNHFLVIYMEFDFQQIIILKSSFKIATYKISEMVLEIKHNVRKGVKMLLNCLS